MGNTLKRLALSLVLISMATACSTAQQEETDTVPAPEPITTTSHQPTSPQSTTTSVAGDQCLKPEQVDASSPDSLAQGFTQVAFCWDSLHDRTMTAAAIRAQPLMTDRLAEIQVEPERNGAQALFTAAHEHGAYALPTAQQAPSEVNSLQTEDNAARVYRVNWDWVGRDGTTTPGGSYLLTVHLTKDQDSLWKVDDYSIADFTEKRN